MDKRESDIFDVVWEHICKTTDLSDLSEEQYNKLKVKCENDLREDLKSKVKSIVHLKNKNNDDNVKSKINFRFTGNVS